MNDLYNKKQAVISRLRQALRDFKYNTTEEGDMSLLTEEQKAAERKRNNEKVIRNYQLLKGKPAYLVKAKEVIKAVYYVDFLNRRLIRKEPN